MITGVGPGTGTALVKKFAQGGYTIAMMARSAKRLEDLEDEIDQAWAFPCDISNKTEFSKAVASIQDRLGNPSVVIHNAVSGIFGNFLEIDVEALERNFRVNTSALLHLAQLTMPWMIKTGKGSLISTGNTSAYRGKAPFAGFAPTKAAQRILIESIAREVWPKGIHAAYIAVDAVIDVPWTRERFPDQPDDFFCKPEDIANECYHLAHQPRSTWTSELTIRPFGENW